MYGADVYGSIPYGAIGFDVASLPDHDAMLASSREMLVVSAAVTTWHIDDSEEHIHYYASTEWTTEPDDYPGSQPFDGRLLSYSFNRSINNGDRFGGLAKGEGQIVLANADGELDDLGDTHAVDSRRVVVRVGRMSDPFVDHLVLFDGVAVDMFADSETLTLTIRDKSDKLDVPAQPNVYAGTGGAEGGNFGPELVTNGTFDSNLSGWTGDTFSYTWDTSGYARKRLGNFQGLQQTVATIAGRTYRVYVRGRGGSGAFVIVIWDGAEIGTFANTSDGTFDVVASTTSTVIRVEINDITSVNPGFDDVSVRLIQTGPEGGENVEGKRKPLTFGLVSGVPPVLIDPALLIYHVHDLDENDDFVCEIVSVYDRGVALSMLPPVAAYADLEAASLSAGEAIASQDGYFRIGGDLAGTIFATVHTYIDGADEPATGDVVRAVLARQGDLVEAIDHASFDVLSSIPQPAHIGVHIGPGDAISAADLIGNLMMGIGGWGGFNRQGRFAIGVFTAPAGSPVAYFSRVGGDIVDLDWERLPAGIWPPPWRWRVAYQRNYTVFTDFSGAVPNAERVFYAEPYRLIEAANSDILADHISAKDPPPVEAYYTDLGRASDEADRLLALYSSGYKLYRFTVSRRALTLKIGDEINVTWPRFGLDAGKNLRIVSIEDKIDLRDGGDDIQVEITAFG
jgi:hypothetical protein